ncbi:cysteine desulfurase family protein [Flavobacteriaceae bacterium 14752]|uniref:cysteine desulfurase family protein n=1 Tax=Mesohalobacter salilacus TaxID=2491711 RepID=UPI000F630B40|nr:cysteine desulfurase [Flavobacteriaceae bacterium 14752]
MKNIYFDSAATSQMREEVIEAMSQSMQECYGNPSSTHAFGRKAKSKIEACRKDIAKTLKVTPGEIIFTSGGTEADNMVLKCAVFDLGVKRIITSKIEHHAVLNTAQFLETQADIKVEYVNLDPNGQVDLNHLEKLLSDKSDKTLVSLMHVNNEIGNMLDLKTVSDLCQNHDALLHSDTVQSIGHFEINLKDCPLDFLAVSAHKFHGPKGVGFAYINKKHKLASLIQGGEQERGHRGGTENVSGIIGLHKAFNLAYQNLENESSYVRELKQYFIENLESKVPEIVFNGLCKDLEKSTYTVINFSLPISEAKAGMLLFQLDLKGIACSQGSACQSGSQQGSFVLNEIYGAEKAKTPSLRFSLSHFNTKEEIDYAVGVLSEFVTSDKVVI